MPEAQLTAKGIRDDAAARLVALNTAAGSRVYGFRVLPVPDDKLPALLVYCADGTGRSTSIGSPVLRWELEVVVECVGKGGTDDDLGDSLDALAESVEAGLLGDPEWIAQFERVPTCSRAVAAAIDGNRRMAVVKLTFAVQFAREYPPPIASAANLSTVELEVDTIGPSGEPDGDPEASATFTLPPP